MKEYYPFSNIDIETDNGFDMMSEDYNMFIALKALPTNQGRTPNGDETWNESDWSWLHRMVFTAVINNLQEVIIPLDVLFRFHKGLMNMSLSNKVILENKMSHVYGRDLESDDMTYIVVYEKLLCQTIRHERMLFDDCLMNSSAIEMMRIMELNEVRLAQVFLMYKKGISFEKLIVNEISTSV